jgi:hypothetical protein
MFSTWVVGGALGIAGYFFWARFKQLARADFIRSYTFPRVLFDKLREKRPELDVKEMQLIARALRQFFLAHLLSGRKFVSMPSQVTDDLWHEFILYTRSYNEFCRRAFGRFMHHTPAVVLGRDRKDNAGLRRAWWYSCKEENINPAKSTRLPLLFAIDAKLGIRDGFVYAPDCRKLRETDTGSTQVHCGGDFSDSSIDGSTDGFGDSDGGSDSGGGDSGCGGGCGGGGGD